MANPIEARRIPPIDDARRNVRVALAELVPRSARHDATPGALGRYPIDAETQTSTTTPGEVLNEEYLDPLGLTQMACADHLSALDEPDGRAATDEAGPPEPDAVVQIFGSADDEGNAVQISGSPASIAL